MQTWAALYLLIWIAFLQFIIILFPIFGLYPAYYVHGAIGIAVVAIAVYCYGLVSKTSCPDRIKRISKTTAIMGIIQGILGAILLVSIESNLASIYQSIIVFFHAVIALAIITQAASTATAFDMWEEKEFLQGSTVPQTTMK